MTDSVTKNLKVEEGVAETLNSRHIPYHILCKSHACERKDSGNLSLLSKIEGQIGLRELIICGAMISARTAAAHMFSATIHAFFIRNISDPDRAPCFLRF